MIHDKMTEIRDFATLTGALRQSLDIVDALSYEIGPTMESRSQPQGTTHETETEGQEEHPSNASKCENRPPRASQGQYELTLQVRHHRQNGCTPCRYGKEHSPFSRGWTNPVDQLLLPTAPKTESLKTEVRKWSMTAVSCPPAHNISVTLLTYDRIQ
jgi:hypothetical protein